MSNAEILRSEFTPNSISKPKLKVQRDSVKLPTLTFAPLLLYNPISQRLPLFSFPSHELPLLLPPDHLRLTPPPGPPPPPLHLNQPPSRTRTNPQPHLTNWDTPTWTHPPPPLQLPTPPPTHLNYHQLHSPVTTPHPHLNHQPHSPTQILYVRWNSHLNDVEKKDYNWVSM